MTRTEARMPDDVLTDLRWIATHPGAIAVVPKSALKILLDAYNRECVTERHGLRGCGDVGAFVGENR